MSQYLNKGTQVAINGSLVQSRWEQDGQTRSKVGDGQPPLSWEARRMARINDRHRGQSCTQTRGKQLYTVVCRAETVRRRPDTVLGGHGCIRIDRKGLHDEGSKWSIVGVAVNIFVCNLGAVQRYGTRNYRQV